MKVSFEVEVRETEPGQGAEGADVARDAHSRGARRVRWAGRGLHAGIGRVAF